MHSLPRAHGEGPENGQFPVGDRALRRVSVPDLDPLRDTCACFDKEIRFAPAVGEEIDLFVLPHQMGVDRVLRKPAQVLGKREGDPVSQTRVERHRV